MNAFIAAVSGWALGYVVGAFGGGWLGSLFDNPSASHMTQGAGAFAGMGLGGLLGAMIGAALGWRLGWRADRREQQQAAQGPTSQKQFQSDRHVAWWTVAICIVLCVLPDTLVAVVNQSASALVPLFFLGVFASLPVVRITTRRTRWPRLLGTLTGLTIGAVVIGCRFGFLALLAGGPVGGLLGYTFAHKWATGRSS